MGFKRDISKVHTHVLYAKVLYRVACSDTLHYTLLCLGEFNYEPEVLSETKEYVGVLFKEWAKLR
jgi:hypothetical protein